MEASNERKVLDIAFKIIFKVQLYLSLTDTILRGGSKRIGKISSTTGVNYTVLFEICNFIGLLELRVALSSSGESYDLVIKILLTQGLAHARHTIYY